MIEFYVPGVPAPQGSKRYLGPGRAIESSKRLPTWRADVRAAAALAWPGGNPLEGPVTASLTFVFERPKNHYRTGRNAHLLRDAAPAAPVGGAADVDKLARAMLDAMTKIVYVDDKQVVELWARKIYAAGDYYGKPGCVVRVLPAIWDLGP